MLNIANIIVPNVLSFLTDGHDDNGVVDTVGTDCVDDDESGECDEDNEDYDDGDGEGNANDEDNEDYDDGYGEDNGVIDVFHPWLRRRVAGG